MSMISGINQKALQTRAEEKKPKEKKSLLYLIYRRIEICIGHELGREEKRGLYAFETGAMFVVQYIFFYIFIWE